MERLQKILSQAGIASRRASEQLMLQGRVTVNGATVRELGTKADAARDDIRVDGRRVKVPEHHRYLLLNKPRGYVTTRSDPERRPTVIDLIDGRARVCLSGRPAGFRIRRPADSHQRRRPRRAADASPPRRVARLRGARPRRARCARSRSARTRRGDRGTEDGAGRRQAHAGAKPDMPRWRSRFARGAIARSERCATRSAIR